MWPARTSREMKDADQGRRPRPSASWATTFSAGSRSVPDPHDRRGQRLSRWAAAVSSSMSCDYPYLRGHRRFRPARDGSRHHAGLRRHAASGASGRPRHGQAADLHRQAISRPTRRYRIGLVNAVYPPTELDARRGEDGLPPSPSNAPIAVRASKQAINEGLEVEDGPTPSSSRRRLFGSLLRERRTSRRAWAPSLKSASTSPLSEQVINRPCLIIKKESLYNIL